MWRLLRSASRQWGLMLKGTRPMAENDGGQTMGMSLVVLMLMVATLVPALEPMQGTPSWGRERERERGKGKVQSSQLCLVQISAWTNTEVFSVFTNGCVLNSLKRGRAQRLVGRTSRTLFLISVTTLLSQRLFSSRKVLPPPENRFLCQRHPEGKEQVWMDEMCR